MGLLSFTSMTLIDTVAVAVLGGMAAERDGVECCAYGNAKTVLWSSYTPLCRDISSTLECQLLLATLFHTNGIHLIDTLSPTLRQPLQHTRTSISGENSDAVCIQSFPIQYPIDCNLSLSTVQLAH